MGRPFVFLGRKFPAIVPNLLLDNSLENDYLLACYFFNLFNIRKLNDEKGCIMNRGWVFVIIIVASAVMCGCQSRIDTVQEQKRLLETDKAFAQYSVDSGVAEAFNHFLADDAIQFSAGAPPMFGRETIYQNMKPTERSYVLQWEPKKAEVSQSGDVGYTWGMFTVSSQDSLGKSQKRFGKYVSVWKKHTDGTWKVALDIGNQNPDPEAK